MTKPIDRVYVVESSQLNSEPFFDLAADSAQRFASATGGTLRVFVPERPWITNRAPDNYRLVEALYRTSRDASVLTKINARFGSEGKWVAESHDLRLSYLDESHIVAWREMEQLPTCPLPGGISQTKAWR